MENEQDWEMTTNSKSAYEPQSVLVCITSATWAALGIGSTIITIAI
jgi:hypothetical protein